MGKAGGGSIRVEINLVMSEEGTMQQASISETAHANYGNSNGSEQNFIFIQNHLAGISSNSEANVIIGPSQLFWPHCAVFKKKFTKVVWGSLKVSVSAQIVAIQGSDTGELPEGTKENKLC